MGSVPQLLTVEEVRPMLDALSNEELYNRIAAFHGITSRILYTPPDTGYMLEYLSRYHHVHLYQEYKYDEGADPKREAPHPDVYVVTLTSLPTVMARDARFEAYDFDRAVAEAYAFDNNIVPGPPFQP